MKFFIRMLSNINNINKTIDKKRRYNKKRFCKIKEEIKLKIYI